MTRTSKQRTGGTALLEEGILDKRTPEIELEDSAAAENQVEEFGSESRPGLEQSGSQQPGSEELGAQENTQRGTQQFVTFLAGDEVFAADMSPVKEIIRVPEVVRVPMAPAALEGLANLRGKVLPILSLRHLFGFPEAAHDDSTRALVIDVGQPLGFVVDRVASVVGVDSGQIEDVGSIRATVNTEVLSGLLKDVGGHAMIMVLDFAKLIEREFSQIAAISKSSSVAGSVAASTKTEE